MRSLRWRSTLLSALAFMASVSVANARDLLEVWQLALERDPIYAASGYARTAGQERLPQARAGLLPYVSAQASADADDSRRARTLSGGDSDTHAQWSLALIQPLFNLPAWNTVKRAEFEVSQADVAHRVAYQDQIGRASCRERV